MKRYLRKIMNGTDLTIEEAKAASQQLFEQDVTDSEIAAFLVGLTTKGETAEEIAGLVSVLRNHAMPFQKSYANVFDNCGTGGDGVQSFNVSTTSAFVLAGGGVKVAKHGNRSVSSKTGSADVLEHLGVSLSFQAEEMKEMLDQNGVTFLFAPHVHPNLKRIMHVRKALKVPTIFNMIGPLTNPVNLDTQLLGTYQRDRLMMMASVLHKLGRKRAIVVNGAGYMDEASLAGENHLVLLDKGELIPFTLRPEEVGLNHYPIEAIRGGDAKENAAILVRVLNGEAGPYYETVLLNAGLAFFAHGSVETVKEGIELAKESIHSGRALEKLHGLIAFRQGENRGVALP